MVNYKACIFFILILTAIGLLGGQSVLGQKPEKVSESNTLPQPVAINADSDLQLAFETLSVRQTDAGTAREEMATKPARPRESVERELTAEGMASYGHYKIFASGSGCKLYTGGFEYDRHSWGYFLGARVDYVAEFLPLVLLRTADTSDIWALQPALPEKPCLESAFHR